MTKSSKVLLQIGAAIVLVIGTVVVTIMCTKTVVDKRGGTLPTELKDGQTITKGRIKDGGISTPQTKEVDTGRLQATYTVGKTYVNLLKTTLTSKGSHKDWGAQTDMTFNYVGEFQFSRHVVANDGRKMTVELRVDRSRTLQVSTKVEGIHIELGGVFQTLLEVGLTRLGAPPGSVEVAKDTLNWILDTDPPKKFWSSVISDKYAKVLADIKGLEGKKARIEFENGTGVLSITPIGCSLSKDEYVLLDGLSFISDVTMMEKIDCHPGATWMVNAQDCFPMLDPSLKATTSGSVTIRRGEDLGQADDKEALLQIAGGVFQLNDIYQDESNKVKRAGSWAPKGDLVFNFRQGIVTEARLSGAADLVQQSLDHVIFQMTHVQRPEYEITYAGWILDGDKPNETPRTTRKLKEGTLDALKRLSRER